MPNPPEFQIILLLGTCSLLFFGLDFWGLYWFLTRQPLLPPQRHRAVPWTGGEVCLVALIHFILLGIPAFFVVLPPGVAPADWSPEQRVDVLRQTAWMSAALAPVELAAILLLLQVVSGTRPYQLGLTGAP